MVTRLPTASLNGLAGNRLGFANYLSVVQGRRLQPNLLEINARVQSCICNTIPSRSAHECLLKSLSASAENTALREHPTIQQQKLLSNPRFGALKAYPSKCLLRWTFVVDSRTAGILVTVIGWLGSGKVGFEGISKVARARQEVMSRLCPPLRQASIRSRVSTQYR